jgi:hypothetical protein
MKAAVIILILLIAILLLLGIIGLAALWFSGGETILLPGLGVLVAVPILIAFFIAVEVVVLLSASLLWRLSS